LVTDSVKFDANHLSNMEVAVKTIFQLLTAASLTLGAVSAPLFAQEKSAPAADETKMDAKGVPGSPDTQSGKAPSDTSGASTTAEETQASTAKRAPGTAADKSKDESKMDAKGVPGSPTTQSGGQPAVTR
jgi:hypothetical protein